MTHETPTVRRFPRLAAAAGAALLAAVLLVGCESPAGYPDGMTDVELWSRNDIRIDTEVPNQYPDGTTRMQPAAEHGDDHDDGSGESTSEDSH